MGRYFLSEAQFPVSCYQTDGRQHVVEFYDHAGGPVARVTFNERVELLEVRWIPIDDYTSGTTAGVAPRASSPPCFLR